MPRDVGPGSGVVGLYWPRAGCGAIGAGERDQELQTRSYGPPHRPAHRAIGIRDKPGWSLSPLDCNLPIHAEEWWIIQHEET